MTLSSISNGAPGAVSLVWASASDIAGQGFRESVMSGFFQVASRKLARLEYVRRLDGVGLADKSDVDHRQSSPAPSFPVAIRCALIVRPRPGADILDKQAGFLHRREVTAARHLGPSHD